MRLWSVKQLFRITTALLKVIKLSCLFSIKPGIHKNHLTDVERRVVGRQTDMWTNLVNQVMA